MGNHYKKRKFGQRVGSEVPLSGWFILCNEQYMYLWDQFTLPPIPFPGFGQAPHQRLVYPPLPVCFSRREYHFIVVHSTSDPLVERSFIRSGSTLHFFLFPRTVEIRPWWDFNSGPVSFVRINKPLNHSVSPSVWGILLNEHEPKDYPWATHG